MGWSGPPRSVSITQTIVFTRSPRSSRSLRSPRSRLDPPAASDFRRDDPGVGARVVVPQTGCFPWVSYVRWPGRRESNIGRTKRWTGRRTMPAIGLVLLSIAMMALLRTDADAKRRSSAQGARRRGPAEAGARSTLGTAARTAAIRRSINAFASARNRPAGEGRVDRRIRYPRAASKIFPLGGPERNRRRPPRRA